MKRDTKIYLILVVIILIIIGGIYAYKYFNKDNIIIDDKLMKCIAGKSVLYYQTGCGHCVDQENILGKYYNLFKSVNCINEQQKCAEAQITSTPAWIINGEKFEGTKTIKELKELTGC